MAEVHYYVDTAVTGPGSGTEGDPYKSISVALPACNSASDTYVIHCTGGDDLIETMLAQPPNTASVKIIGEWAGFNLNDAVYRIKRTGANDFVMISVDRVGGTVSFERVLFENGPTQVPASNASSMAVSGGTLELINCGFVCHSGADSTTLYYATRGYNATSALRLINSTFMFGSVAGGTFSGNTRLCLLNQESVDSVVSNCIFHPGANSSPLFIIAGGTSNAAVPDYTNCIVTGSIAGGSNSSCVLVSTQNSLSSGSTQMSVAAQNANFWVSPTTGDFTPLDLLTGHSTLVDSGEDYSATSGTSLDVNGNDRNDPAAGAGWDIGPYEWGFVGGPYPGEHIVTNIDNASDPNCIYFGQGVKIGDTFSFKETTEINGWGVDIDADGYPIIDSGGATGTDSFLFDIDKGAGYVNPSEWTFTIGQPPVEARGSNVIGGAFRTQGAAVAGAANLEAFLVSEGWGTTRAGENFTVRSGVHEWHFTWAEAQAGVYESMLPAPLRSDIDDGMGR